MRMRLLDVLRCPMSGSALDLEVFSSENDPAGDAEQPTRVVEGILRDAEGTYEYPVIGAVPRMLLPGERKGLGERYPEYFAAHRDRLGNDLLQECAGAHAQDRVQSDIIDRFGYEWTEFEDYDSDNFLYWIEPIRPAFFKGKFGLDIGCGAGG